MSLLRNSLIYTGIAVLQKGIGLLLLPLYTAYLAPADYGVIGTVTAVVGLLTLLYPLGGDASILRHFFPAGAVQAHAARVWGTLTMFLFMVGLGMTVVLWFTHPWFLDRLLGQVAFWPCVATGLGMAWFASLRSFYSLSLQIRQRGIDYLRVEGGFVVFRLLLFLLLVVGLQWKATGALLAFLVAEGVFCVIAMALFSRDVEWSLDRTVLRQSLSYSLPVVPHYLAGWSTTYLSALVVNHWFGTEEVGLYTLAANFALIQTFLIGGVGEAYLPRIFAALSSGDTQGMKHALHIGFLALCLFGLCAVGLSLFSGEVLRWLTPPVYWGAERVIPWLVLGGFLQGFYLFFSNLLYFHQGGTRFLPIASFSGAMVSVGLMALWIPRHSILGAGAAAACGVAVRLVTAACICHHRFSVPWRGMFMARVVWLTLAVCAFLLVAPHLSIISGVTFLWKSILLIAYAGILGFWVLRLRGA